MKSLKPGVCPTLTADFGLEQPHVNCSTATRLAATTLSSTTLHYFSTAVTQTLTYLHPFLLSPLKKLAPLAKTHSWAPHTPQSLLFLSTQ